MTPLVTPLWVVSHLRSPGTVVLDATLPPVGVAPALDVRARYVEGHLPGAVFFDIEALSDRTTTLPHMLPAPEVFAGEMSKLGIGDEMNVVVYEQGDVFSAPRAWWMLRILGAKHVHILDGGLRGWMEAGLPVEAGEVERPTAEFHARLDRKGLKDYVQVQQMISQGSQIVDARSSGRFQGTAPEPRAGIRSGHMPGASNVPYTELIHGNRLKSIPELEAVFARAGVVLGTPSTTTCGSGVTAAVVALALELCGAHHVSLYDGSWAEYAQQADAMIEGAS